MSKERLMMTTNSMNLIKPSKDDDVEEEHEMIKPPTKNEIWNVEMPENIQKVEDLVEHFKELFSGKLGTCKYLKVPIDTEESKPIKSPMRFYPKWKQVVIEEIMSKLLEKGIVRESFAPWRAWPLILVKGDGGGYRCCIDYRELNKVTKEFAFPKPQIKDIESRLGGGKTRKMMLVDVSQAYYQCMLEPSDTEKTAFSTHNGHYEFIRMAFGLKNAVAYFIYIKNKILGNLIGTVCEVFIDDILILGRTDEELLKNAFLVFSALERAGMTLNKAKIKFDMPEIKYVGMILTADGIKPNPDKVKSILELEPPQSISDIRQLMGMVNWFNKFIPDLASIAKPIYDLTSPKNEYKWDENCELAFNEIKFQLSNMVMKAYPDFDKEFIIECDASAIGYGAKLYQMTDDNKEKIIEFTSKSLNRSESEWPATKRELGAMVWSTLKFRDYITGKRFTIVSDAKSLKELYRIKDPHGVMARWAIYLQGLPCQVMHRAGKSQIVSDFLSRHPIKDEQNFDMENNKLTENIIEIEDEMNEILGTIDVKINASNFSSRITKDIIKKEQ